MSDFVSRSFFEHGGSRRKEKSGVFGRPRFRTVEFVRCALRLDQAVAGSRRKSRDGGACDVLTVLGPLLAEKTR